MSKVIVDEIQTDTTNGNVRVIPNGTGALEVKGAGGDDAMLQLNCSAQSHGVKLKSPAHSAGQSYTMILPDNQIAASKLPKVKSVTNNNTQLEYGDVPTAASGLVNLDAANLTSGTLPAARCPSFRASAGDRYKFILTVPLDVVIVDIELPREQTHSGCREDARVVGTRPHGPVSLH